MKYFRILSVLSFYVILNEIVCSSNLIGTRNYIDWLSTMFKQIHDWRTHQGLHKGTRSKAFRTECISEVLGSGDTLTGTGQWYGKFYCAGMSFVSEMSSHVLKLAVYNSARQFIKKSLLNGELEDQDLEDTFVSLLKIDKNE